MLMVSISYVAPPEEVERLRAPHLEWLRQGYEAGHFIGWGRKNPPTGGIVLARGDRAAIAALAQTDPFVTGNVATAEVIEWTPSFLAEGVVLEP